MRTFPYLRRAAAALSIILVSLPVSGVPRDRNAIISDTMTQEALDGLAQLIESQGYRCDSISAASPMIFTRGFDVTCNGWRYSYEIEDRGGRWTVCYDDCD